MMGHREGLKTGAEVDVLYGRHLYCYLANSTAAHKIKKQMTRRNRHEKKQELRGLLCG